MSLNVDRPDAARPPATERPKRRRERDPADAAHPGSGDAAATPIDSFLAVLVGAMRPATPPREKAMEKAGEKETAGPASDQATPSTSDPGTAVPGSAHGTLRPHGTSSTVASAAGAGDGATPAAEDVRPDADASGVATPYGPSLHADRGKEQTGGPATDTSTSTPSAPPSAAFLSHPISVVASDIGPMASGSPSGPSGRGATLEAVDASKRRESGTSAVQPNGWAAIASGSIGARELVVAGEAGSEALATVPGQVVRQLAAHLPPGAGEKTLVMRLNPPTLGEVLLRITSREGQPIRLRFDVAHGETREALARGASHIEDLLRSHGLAADGFSIDVHATAADRPPIAGDGQNALGNPTPGPGGDGASAGYAQNPGRRGGDSARPDRAEEGVERDVDSEARIRLVSGSRLVDYHL